MPYFTYTALIPRSAIKDPLACTTRSGIQDKEGNTFSQNTQHISVQRITGVRQQNKRVTK